MALEREMETYRRGRAGWVQAGLTGRWVVIRGGQAAGFYPTLEAALRAGYERFGLDAVFMAKLVAGAEKPVRSSRRAVCVPRRP